MSQTKTFFYFLVPAFDEIFRCIIVNAIFNRSERLARQALERQLLDGLAGLSSALSAGMAPVRQAVIGLFNLGMSRQEMVERGAAAGYNRKTLGKLTSQILCGAGQRLRKPGGGRKRGFSPDALAVLASVRSQYGDAKAGKLLLAAYRAWKAQAAAQAEREQAADFCDRNKPIPNSHPFL